MAYQENACAPDLLERGQSSTDPMIHELATAGSEATSGKGGICALGELVGRQDVTTYSHDCPSSATCHLAQLMLHEQPQPAPSA